MENVPLRAVEPDGDSLPSLDFIDKRVWFLVSSRYDSNNWGKAFYFESPSKLLVAK